MATTICAKRLLKPEAVARPRAGVALPLAAGYKGTRHALQAQGVQHSRGRQVHAAALALAAPEGVAAVGAADWLLQGYNIQFGLFSAAALAFGVRSLSSKSVSERSGNHLSAMINFIAAMSYFAMAHGQGQVWLVEGDTATELFWARYADWVLTTPMLLAHLVSFGGLAKDQWLLLIVSDVLMIATGLAGELVADPTKWAWFGFACLFQIIIAVQLFGPAKDNAYAKSEEGGDAYSKALYYLILVWAAYPIVWGLDHGTGTVSPTTAGLVYAVLDFIAKPAFSALMFYLPLHEED